MRFFKIFLVSFFSLIGVVGIILGIMYLAGSFSGLMVEPNEIHFDGSEYLVDDNFSLTIRSNTEDANVLGVNLSLKNQDGEAVDGYITDGVIKIPEKVLLNRPFEVELTREPYSENMTKDWIVGGQSEIFASSESSIALDNSCKVFVDVPVDYLQVKTYKNNSTQEESNSFALGESFYAEAIFFPESSKYKYSTEETKSVFFDISTNRTGYIAENQEITEAMKSLGKTHVFGFDVLKVSNDISVDAYVFHSAKFEDNFLSMYFSEDEAISYVKNSTYGNSSKQKLSFTNRTVKDFQISQISGEIKYNNISNIYANINDSEKLNLGIQIFASNQTSIQNKIKDVGLRILVDEGGVLRDALDSEIAFLINPAPNKSETDYIEYDINSNGEGFYYKNSDGDYELISSEIVTRYAKVGTVYEERINGAYCKVGTDYMLISEHLDSQTYDKYYLPNFVSTNADNSYWTVVAFGERISFKFQLKLFAKGDVLNIDSSVFQTVSWISGEEIDTALIWKNSEDVHLTFIDSSTLANRIFPEYNLLQNIKIENNKATYKEIKFLAFSNDDNVHVSDILKNATPTNKYNLSEFGITNDVYEIDNGILKASGAGAVSVIAVIIKTNYQGYPLYDEEDKFQIYTISTKELSPYNYCEINFIIDKTLQDINASIVVKENMLKNLPQENQPRQIDKLAFMQNQNQIGKPVFTVDITVSADVSTTIENEVQLFIEAWEEGRIRLKTYTLTGLEVENLLFFDRDIIINEDSGTYSDISQSWTLSIEFFTFDCHEDIELYLKLIYEQTTTNVLSKFLTNVDLPADINDIRIVDNLDYITIEVYDGYASSVAFAFETTEQNFVEKTVSISGDTEIGNKFLAEEVSVAYFFDSENVTDELINSDGSFKINFTDKYGNEIEVSPENYMLTTEQLSKTITVKKHSSTLHQQPTAKLYIKEESAGHIVKVLANFGKVESGIFESEYVDRTSDYNLDLNHVVKITRYGAKSEIDLLGAEGLLHVEFQAAENGKVYELYNTLMYNIATSNWENTYAGYLSLSGDELQNELQIKIEKTIGKDIILNIIVNTGLGYTVNVELIIKSNVSITAHTDEIEGQEGASDYTKIFLYQGIYSDNDVKILLDFTIKLNETITINKSSNADSSDFNGNQSLQLNALQEEIFLTVHYSESNLGMQTVEIKTGDGAYDYKKIIYLYVNPNLKLKDAENEILEKHIEIEAINEVYSVLSSDDYERIVGDKQVSSGVALNFAETNGNFDVFKITNGDRLRVSNIFELVGFEIEAVSELSGEYLAILDVRYGDKIVGQVYLYLQTNLKINLNHDDFSEMFIEYNGITHLMLVSNKNYEFDYLKELFLNVKSLQFSQTNLEGVYSSDNNLKKISVSDINSYNSGYYLKLKSDVGEILFPVLFSPLEKGFVQYEENPENETFVQRANNDIEYLMNHGNFLIENNICGYQDSGTSSSLLQNVYEISENDENVFTIKNYSENILYFLVHVNDEYYSYKLAAFNKNSVAFEFSLENFTPNGWTNVGESRVATELQTSENKTIGAFVKPKLIEENDFEFSNATKVEAKKSGGLSVELIKSNFFSARIIDEINGNVDFFQSTNSELASYDLETGILQTQSLTEDRFVWLLINKGNNLVVVYRICILANSALNIYYPYGNGIGTSWSENNDTDDAEYVDFKNVSGDLKINLKNEISSAMPNCLAGENIKRIMFQYGDEEKGWTNAPESEYTLTFSIYKMSVNGIITQNPENFLNYAYLDAKDDLTILNTQNSLIIYLKVNAFIKGKDINATIYYKIVVNDTSNFELYYKDENGNLTEEKFNKTVKTVDFGNVFDFSKVVLVTNTGDGGLIPDQKNLLDFYLYSAEGKNLKQYLDLNMENKTLSLKNNVQIVSDLTARLVAFTKFGKLIEVEVIFKSSIDYEFNQNQSTVSFVETNSYEVFTDTEFNFSQIFSLVGTENVVDGAIWEYSLDGVEYNSASDVVFEQNQTGDYLVFIKVLLSEFDSAVYKDNYIFSINLKVKNSIISNYPNLNNPMLIESGAIEYPIDGKKTFENLLFIESETGDIEYLLSVYDLSVLNRYEITLKVKSGDNYVSVNMEETDFNLNKFTLNFNSPAEEVEIILILSLKGPTNVEIEAFLSFRLKPDLELIISYPSPDDIIYYEKEVFYLNNEYINGTNNSNDFGQGSNEIIKLNGKGFFNTTRVVFKNSNGIVESSSLINRVIVSVKSISNNIVVSFKKSGSNIINENINFEAGATLNSSFYFQWVGMDRIVTSAEGSIVFNIYVDGIERGTYKITFYSNIKDIFQISITPHNETISYTNVEDVGDVEAEVFFVEKDSSDQLFSLKDALLSFYLRESYATSLGGTTAVWQAYIDAVASGNMIGSIEFNANSSEKMIKWPLSAPNAIDPISFENLIILIGENQYVFNQNAENRIPITTTYVNPVSYTLTNRAKATFLGTEMPYEKFSSIITFNGSSVENFTISKSDQNAIDKVATVTIEANIGTNKIVFDAYYYTLIYDFKIDPFYDVNALNNPYEVFADDNEVIDLLDKFSITRYHGKSFSMDYFLQCENIISAKIIMATDSEYETTQSTDNIKYLNEEFIKYYKPEYEAIASQPEFETYSEYILITPKNMSSGKTYNYSLKPNGAENEGNYVYILFSFSPDASSIDMAYAVVKVFVRAVWNPVLYNDKNHDYNDINTDVTPLIISYNPGTSEISPITLSSDSSTENMIEIFKGNNTENFAVKNYFRYYIEGELGGYLKIGYGGNSEGYITGYVKIEKDTNTARYADKIGHLRIVDKYGYEIYYYITLEAQLKDSLNYASLIIGTNNNNSLFEGSTISIVDSGYNVEEQGAILTDYAIKINNLNTLSNFTYDITYEIDNVDVESYNSNPNAENYNTGKIKVQPAAFYKKGSNPNIQLVNLKIKLNITGENYSEIAIINVPINIVKRYTVSDLGNAYVRDGIAFSISDYIYIRDLKAGSAGEDVGEITLSQKAFTLEIPESLSGATITIAAVQEGATSGSEQIVVGKNIEDNSNKQTTNGNYYYSLKSLSKFKDYNFTQYKFCISSVALPNNSGFYLSNVVYYLYSGNGDFNTQTDNNKYIFNNSFDDSVDLVYNKNGTYLSKTFSKGNYEIKIETISTSNGWTVRDTGPHSEGMFGIYKGSTELADGDKYESSSFEMIPDKLLSVVTLDLESEESVDVVLNNIDYLVRIPFYLNFDGVQNVSVYEAILRLCNGNTNDPRLLNVIAYEKDSEAMSLEDLQKLKGVMIYNNTISLEIAEGMRDVFVTVKVYYNEEQSLYKIKDFKIINNNAHYYFISIYDILGDSLGLNITGDYKIEIMFTITEVESGTQETFKNNVKLFDEFEQVVTYDYNQENQNCYYKITVESFKIQKMPIENQTFTDMIKIKHSSDFRNKIKDDVKKFYLVRYSKDQVVYSISVNYKVTPKYYAVDNGGNEAGGNYKVIYRNQYDDEINNTFAIPFNVWADGFNLQGYKGDNIYYNIKTLESAVEDLYFEVQTIDQNNNQTGSGAATLDENNMLRTTTSFDASSHYIKVLVYTYVDKNLDYAVVIGEIYVKINTTSISVPAPGLYNLTIGSPKINGTYFKVNTPYEFTGKTASVGDIVSKDNPNLQDLVNNKNELGFYTGNLYNYKPADECSFSVVTVISKIEKPTYKDEKLSIKINLTETQTSINQKVELEAIAQPKYDTGSHKISNPFFLTVRYGLKDGSTSENEYSLIYRSSENAIEEKIIKVDGYYTVIISRSDIFSETFVGSDYTYEININGITNETQPDPLAIVYADNSTIENVGADETMFFQVSYKSNVGNIECRYVGLQYNPELSSPLGLAISLKNIEGLGLSESQLQNCTTSFLGSFEINCSNEAILLLSFGNESQTTYSLAKVSGYSAENPFLVEDYAKSLIKFQTAETKSVSIYDFNVHSNGESLTYLFLESGASEDKFYGIISQENVDLYGIKPINSRIILNVTSYSEQKSVTIKNFSVSSNVSNLSDGERTYWISSHNESTATYTSTLITKETSSVTYNQTWHNLEQFKFEFAPGYWNGDIGESELISTTPPTINLSSIVEQPINSNDSYFFSLEKEGSEIKYVAIPGADLENIDIETLLSELYDSNFNGIVKLSNLNIAGEINESGLYKFAIYDWLNSIHSIKAEQFSKIENTAYFSFNNSLVGINKKAELITGNSFNLKLSPSPTVNYYKISKNNSETYLLTHLTQETTYEVDISGLSEGEIIEFSKSENSILVNTQFPLTLILTSSSADHYYVLRSGEKSIDIYVPPQTTSFEIDLSENFDAGEIEIYLIENS